MEAHAKLVGSTDLVVDPAVVGIDVEVVSHGRAAGQHQFAESDEGADMNCFGRQARPDGVEGP